jgi:hypothetical protein
MLSDSCDIGFSREIQRGIPSSTNEFTYRVGCTKSEWNDSKLSVFKTVKCYFFIRCQSLNGSLICAGKSDCPIMLCAPVFRPVRWSKFGSLEVGIDTPSKPIN